jgi:Domain of unknown function (DUF4832)/Domain of unknown function (DUF4874)
VRAGRCSRNGGSNENGAHRFTSRLEPDGLPRTQNADLAAPESVSFESTTFKPNPRQPARLGPDDENFPNPERGFHIQKDGWDKVIHPDWESLTLEDMQRARTKGISLVRVYYVINEFRDQDLSSAMLGRFAQNLSDARTAGVKLIPLFTYSYPKTNDYAAHPERPENQDAPLNVILGHLEQLRGIIRDNADVIAFWDAGFIGPWGEWHDSTNGLLGTADRWDALNDKSRTILEKLLAVLPADRTITLRYPRHKQDATGPAALTPQEAYSKTPKARLGAKDDCFLASNTNWGTYNPDDPKSIQAQKDFLNQDNQYLPQAGETCNAAAAAQPYINCDNALKELAYMRWSAINQDYHPDVLQGWKTQGCYATIERKLGYRYRLLDASLPTAAPRGSGVTINLNMTNDGWARPYNPRTLEIVLKAKTGGKLTRLAVAPPTDARLFLPAPGETKTLELSLTLPATLETGQYDVLLNLPDPAPSLHDRPEYSIRLANEGVWEASTGFNSLNATLEVKP